MKQWQSLMAAEEKRVGLPTGTLASLVQQETGGQQRFIDNPGDFHYKVGPNGESPKSSARGLGGILKATAKDPGYGVAPLKDWSAPEQLRFMADYTQARIKQAGSVQAGLAGYGEGDKYSQQVLARLGKPVKQSPLQLPDEAFAKQEPPVVVAQAPEHLVQPATPVEQPLQVAVTPQQQVTIPAPEQVVSNQWDQFQNVMPVQFKPNDINYVSPLSRPQLSNAKPNFSRFKDWLSKA